MNLFIIGAGFSKAIFPGAPLNGDLLSVLARKSADSAASILCRRYKTRDIEIALTRLDSDIIASKAKGKLLAPEGQDLRDQIENELAEFFNNFTASDELFTTLPWLAPFVDRTFNAGDVVISLNYDCILEGALDCCNKWSPRGGYGPSFEQPLVYDDEFRESPVTILKIHGSANFVIAPCTDNPTLFDVNFLFNERYFPHSAKNTEFGYGAGTEKSYLIAPSYVKIPTVEITCLMLDALSASATATNLIIIGCALREEDGFLRVLITNFLRQPSLRAKKVFIVNPQAHAIRTSLTSYFGGRSASQIIPLECSIEVVASSFPQLLYDEHEF